MTRERQNAFPVLDSLLRRVLLFTVAACLGSAIYFVPLAIQRAAGSSAESALAYANSGYDAIVDGYMYLLESQYVDDEGRAVYRLVSDTDPVIVKELRYGFRWLPELNFTPIALFPAYTTTDPGPYFELVNGDEYLRTIRAWDEEQERRKGTGS